MGLIGTCTSRHCRALSYDEPDSYLHDPKRVFAIVCFRATPLRSAERDLWKNLGRSDPPDSGIILKTFPTGATRGKYVIPRF